MVFKEFDSYLKDGGILTEPEFNQQLSLKIAFREDIISLYRALLDIGRSNEVFDWDDVVDGQYGDLSKKNLLKRTKELILVQSPGILSIMRNFHPSADTQILEAEFTKGAEISFSNIAEYKNYLREANDLRWTRVLTDNEKQGSVSVLGSISEKLLEKALGSLVDGENLFQTNQDDTKSYGDFVLLGLPNNLWFSVKSGFARERLLASGFANDLIGVGFFQDPSEFTSFKKVRNFKKVGFLAIYLPDMPITEKQEENRVSTYGEVMQFYTQDAPQNINSTDFYRPLSQLGKDIEVLAARPIQQRSILDF